MAPPCPLISVLLAVRFHFAFLKQLLQRSHGKGFQAKGPHQNVSIISEREQLRQDNRSQFLVGGDEDINLFDNHLLGPSKSMSLSIVYSVV